MMPADMHQVLEPSGVKWNVQLIYVDGSTNKTCMNWFCFCSILHTEVHNSKNSLCCRFNKTKKKDNETTEQLTKILTSLIGLTSLTGSTGFTGSTGLTISDIDY